MAITAKNRLFEGDIGNNNTQGKAMPNAIFAFTRWETNSSFCLK